MIIKPARRATTVSMEQIWNADFSRSTSFLVYEPNVISVPQARDME